MLATTSVSTVAAQPEEGEAVSTGVTLDLPAMTLDAEDFPVEGLLAEYGRIDSIDHVAEVLAGTTGDSIDDSRDYLESIGWLGRYFSPFSISMGPDDSLAAVVAISLVTEYEDEAGAEEGFDLPPVEDGEPEEIDAPEVGDESRLIQIEDGQSTTGQRYTSLNLTFRLDNLVGSVVIFFYEDSGYEPVSVEAMADSAETLIDRIETALDGDTTPNLSLQIVRPDRDPSIAWFDRHEVYIARDGELIPRVNLTDDLFDGTTEFNESTGVIDDYLYESYFVEYDDSDAITLDASYLVHVTTFESERDAADYPEAVIEDYAPEFNYYQDVEILETSPASVGEINGFSYRLDVGEDRIIRGYRLFLQVGTTVISIEVDGNHEIELNDVIMLLEAQASCAEDSSMCDPLPMIDIVRTGKENL
jgi:hypothetical protein